MGSLNVQGGTEGSVDLKSAVVMCTKIDKVNII